MIFPHTISAAFVIMAVSSLAIAVTQITFILMDRTYFRQKMGEQKAWADKEIEILKTNYKLAQDEISTWKSRCLSVQSELSLAHDSALRKK